MAALRDAAWKDDQELKEKLVQYVREGLKREEILSFVKQNFGQYAWSIRSLDRRLRHYNIFYSDREVTVEEVRQAVAKELDGPSKLIGYRPMQKKVRINHGLNVPRDLVYAMMKDLDAEGVEARAPAAKKKKRTGHFSTKGTNWVHSLDGHDKLMGYQNSTYPIAIYGSIDSASRKILLLRVWVTNSDPEVIGRFYLEHLYETRLISTFLRLDKGTETTVLCTMHAFLRRHHGDMEPTNTVLYGPSTSNQIERWWREIHERMEMYFKEQLNFLKDQLHYDPHDEKDRSLLAFIMIPVIQRELDEFRNTVWNPHRIRKQDTNLPDGVPNHMHEFPEEYGLQECGWPLTEEQIQEAATVSGVLNVPTDFLSPEFRAECERCIPHPEKIESSECKNAFIFLKERANV